MTEGFLLNIFFPEIVQIQNLEIRICDKKDVNYLFLKELYAMINDVFLLAEAEIWNDHHQRISIAFLSDLINKGELMVAKINNELVSCVRIELISNKVAKFGMLTVSPSYKGRGIGSKLVKEVERYVINKGRVKLRLELLTPKNVVNTKKEFLLNWYNRIGYQFFKQQQFELIDPEENVNLKIPCYLNLYEKNLVSNK